MAGEIGGEDALDDRCGGGVGLEAVQAAAFGGLARVGVGAGVGEPVAVGRAAAKVSAFEFGLGGHGGAHADLDAVAFAFRHAAEDGHHQVVGLGLGVDGPADLGDPEPYSIVDEHGESQAVLVAVEGALRFADDHSLELPVGLLEQIEQGGGPGAAFPRQRA